MSDDPILDRGELEHYAAAEEFLAIAQDWAEQRNEIDDDAEASFLMVAQVHATLALATAVNRLVDSSNGSSSDD